MNLTAVEIYPITNNKFKVARVTMVIDDAVYLKGEICRKNDGGFWISVANAPWKDKDGKWQNNYVGGFLSRDTQNKIETYVISLYTSNQMSYVDPNSPNYLAWKGGKGGYKKPQQPINPPVQQPQQQQAPQQPNPSAQPQAPGRLDF